MNRRPGRALMKRLAEACLAFVGPDDDPGLECDAEVRSLARRALRSKATVRCDLWPLAVRALQYVGPQQAAEDVALADDEVELLTTIRRLAGQAVRGLSDDRS